MTLSVVLPQDYIRSVKDLIITTPDRTITNTIDMNTIGQCACNLYGAQATKLSTYMDSRAPLV
jgi:hypothetical protein